MVVLNLLLSFDVVAMQLSGLLFLYLSYFSGQHRRLLLFFFFVEGHSLLTHRNILITCLYLKVPPTSHDQELIQPLP